MSHIRPGVSCLCIAGMNIGKRCTALNHYGMHNGFDYWMIQPEEPFRLTWDNREPLSTKPGRYWTAALLPLDDPDKADAPTTEVTHEA